MIHPLDRERRLDEDQYWRQRQGHGKLMLDRMITNPDVWRGTVPWGVAAGLLIQDFKRAVSGSTTSASRSWLRGRRRVHWRRR